MLSPAGPHLFVRSFELSWIDFLCFLKWCRLRLNRKSSTGFHLGLGFFQESLHWHIKESTLAEDVRRRTMLPSSITSNPPAPHPHIQRFSCKEGYLFPPICPFRLVTAVLCVLLIIFFFFVMQG